MKVALIAGYKYGAIDQVMRPLAKGLQDLGEEADVINVYEYINDPSKDKTFGNYDLVHFGYFMYGQQFRGYIANPMTANLWHIPIGREQEYGNILANLSLERIIVDDVMTLQQLGQMEITNVTPVPILFDYARFKPLPPPEGPFTVGIFCNNYPYKRWEIITEACQELGIPCHAVVTQQDRKDYNLDPVDDVYKECHVLAHATFVDTNSLPLREAILCGRPVIATHNDGLNQVIREGVNGLFYDGSKSDLKRAITEARDHYDDLRYGALNTILPSPESIVAKYHSIFKKALDEVHAD